MDTEKSIFQQNIGEMTSGLNMPMIKIANPILKYPGKNVVNLIDNCDFKKYLKDGNIKSIEGVRNDLEQVKDGVRYPGRYKFTIYGNFTWDSPDIVFFDKFIGTLIEDGFFRGELSVQ